MFFEIVSMVLGLAKSVLPLPATDAEVEPWLDRIWPEAKPLIALIAKLATADEALPMGDVEALVAAEADKAGFDPAIIMLIVQAVLAILDAWRKRREG